MNCRLPPAAGVVLTALLFLTPASAAEDAAEAVRQDVLAAQAERIRAMVEADLEALEGMLSDDLVYNHTTGRSDSRAELLASLRPGGVDYRLIEPQESTVRVYGNTAVVTGRAALRVVAAGQTHDLHILFTEVYVLTDRWRLASWQSTRLPPQAAGR